METNKIISILVLFALSLGCTETIVDPTPNPFLDNQDSVFFVPEPEPDSNSLEGLHKYIFSPTCASPGCHDGAFEPDFRTPQSSYSTLLYHALVKKDSLRPFRYRVVPFSSDSSWLVLRLTTDNPLLGQMPLYMPALDEKELGHLQSWINSGAPDLSGNISVYPNLKPMVLGRKAYNQNAESVGGNYDSWGDPFLIPLGSNLELRFEIWDDSTSISELEKMEIHFSPYQDHSSDVIVYQATHYKENEIRAFLFSSDFPLNQPIFMRVVINDGDNSEDVYYPNEKSSQNRIGYYSFLIEP